MDEDGDEEKRTINLICSLLGPTGASDAIARGRALTQPDAIRYALDHRARHTVT